MAGHKLRAWRKAQEPPLSQGELGARFGVSAMTISRIEKGRQDPSLKFMHAVDRAGIATLDEWTQTVPADPQAPRPSPSSARSAADMLEAG